MAAAASSEKINTESTHEMTKSVSENSIRPIVTDGLSDALLRIATDTHSQFFLQISHSQKWTSDSQKNANCDRLDTPANPHSLLKSANSLLLYCVPLSVTKTSGTPCRANTDFMAFMAVRLVEEVKVITSGNAE